MGNKEKSSERSEDFLLADQNLVIKRKRKRKLSEKQLHNGKRCAIMYRNM
jgi:hypothetical protein